MNIHPSVQTLFAGTLLAVSLSLSQTTDFSLEHAAAMHRVLAVEIGPRPMGSPAEQDALRFAAEQFRQYGCDTAYVMPMSRTSRANTSSGVAVGIKYGKTKRIIVIGGHIDSSGPEIPGADDNASGSAVVIELARVFGQRQMESTLVFACFGGEEQGLEGSEYFVDHFANIDSVALMLNIDMANGLEILDVDGDAHGISAPKWLVCAAFDEARKLGYEHLRYPTHFFTINYAGRSGAGSDHEPFLQAGIPAIDLSTDVNRPIHTPQDNIQNFDPRGMKRSGDIVVKLVERFDGGVPDKNLGQYFLYVIGFVRIFVPHWLIDFFLIVTALIAVAAFVLVRKRRIFPLDVRWSGWKMFLVTMITIACAWLAPDIVGFLKGVRYPWFADVSLYYGLAAVAAAFGLWLSLILSQRMPVSRCPYVYYKRAAVILGVFVFLCRWTSVELAVYPASALFLLSLAVILHNRVLKVVLAVLSPLWMIRLVFNEWYMLLFSSVASAGAAITTFMQSLLYNGVLILLGSVYAYPLFLGIVAAYRDANMPQRFSPLLRSRVVGSSLAVFLLVAIVYLSGRESYSDAWNRQVMVEYRPPERGVDTTGSFVILRSNEYLDGIRIKRPSGDTLLSGRITEARIPVPETDLLHPAARMYGCQVNTLREQREYSGDTATYEFTTTALCTNRPYTLSVTYRPSKEFTAFSSPLVVRTERRNRILHWYSYPDTAHIAVRFSIARNDSLSGGENTEVEEQMEWVFDRIMPAWEFEAERTSFIQRTRITTMRIIKL